MNELGLCLFNDELLQGLPNRHLTPASSEWTQLCTPSALAGQSTSRLSVPVHWTLSRRMDPVPWPKKAEEKACASVWQNYVHHYYCKIL